MKGFNLPQTKQGVEWEQFSKVITMVVEYSPEEDPDLMEAIYNHYRIMIEETSYGFVDYPPGTDTSLANSEYFGISTREEAFEQLSLQEIFTDLSFTDIIYANLTYSCPWESEHGVKIGIMNGKFDSIL